MRDSKKEGQAVREVFETNEPVPVTLENQLKAPVQHVSQPSANKPIESQTQPVIKSIPKDEVDFYEFNEDDLLKDVNLEARPLVMDQSYKIKPIDKHYAFRWINCKGGGLLLNKAIANGWIYASEKDLLPIEKGGHQATVGADGRLYLGFDTVLMKLPKHIYAAIIKGNLLRSMNMVRSKNATKQAMAQAGNIVTQGRGQPNFDRHGVEFFQPQGQDLKVKDVHGQERDVLENTSKADTVYETL